MFANPCKLRYKEVALEKKKYKLEWRHPDIHVSLERSEL